jgi:hypothetical protein
MGVEVFAWCFNLASVSIPGSVKTIETRAFYGFGVSNNSSKLASVTIGDGVEHIEQAAFGYCTSLTSISIPK